MAYYIYDENDQLVAGDPTLDMALVEVADQNSGYYIIDTVTGKKVYPVEIDESPEEPEILPPEE